MPTGRTDDRRSDFNEVYGDWAEIKSLVRTPERIDRDVATALRHAEADPAGISDNDALALFAATGPSLEAVASLADELRQATVGDDVTYVVNRNINFTNVCYTGCRFCAFAQRRDDADAYTLSLEEVGHRAEQAWALGATEVCLQGGIHPDLPGTAYFEIAREIKTRVPELHVHAFSPMEVVNGASRTGLSIREWLIAAREAGLDTIPGTAAEILDDDVRWVLTKGKLPAASWIEVITTAHEVGLRSSSTMMYGHVDNPTHWVAHLRTLSRIQDQTGGFTEFVPLPFIHTNAPLYLAGVARPGTDDAGEPGGARDRADHAARPHRQHPDLVGEARRRRLAADAARGSERPRRHADGRDDQPYGRVRARFGEDGGRTARDRRTACPGGARGSAPRRTARWRPSASRPRRTTTARCREFGSCRSGRSE